MQIGRLWLSFVSAGWAPPDLLNPQDRQLLAMTVFSTVVLSPLFLKDDNLRAARLLDNPGAHGSVWKRWPANGARVAIANCEDVVKRNLSTNVALKPLNHNLVAGSDPVLLSTRLQNCKHSRIRIPQMPGTGLPGLNLSIAQSSPRRSRPSGEIICGFQGGSHTISTFASPIPGIESSF